MSEIRARLAGDWARMALARPSVARVVAVFSSVFYLRFETGLVAIAQSGIEPGPLTLVTDAGTDWQRAGLRVGQQARITADALHVAGISMSLATIETWKPPQVLYHDNRCLQRGLDALLPSQRMPACVTAEVSRAISGWLADPKTHSLLWAQKLLGRGPGLTPAGDDFLGGLMIALHGTGRARLAREIWHAVEDASLQQTNEISHALLAAAASGQGSASLHRVMQVLFDGGGDLPAALAEIDRIGHSSGWDALAGMSVALSIVQDQPEIRAA